MALIHRAQLTPTKLDLLTAWVPARTWLGDADASRLEIVGSYRFDDPAGAVGIETHILRTIDGRIVQVPLTYRAEPLAGAELVGIMEHSVLGTRYTHDGCSDPVYVHALAAAILTGGREALLELVDEEEPAYREPTIRVTGSGTPDVAVPAIDSVHAANAGTVTVMRAAGLELVLPRVLDTAETPAERTLIGTWDGQEPVLLARIR
ncbi:MAG TPA: hypothetical protein VHC49_19150 [Mycobacteriales bacterium]|nr:hypothetical protein [Mycobacteriales bacterium]